MTAPKASSPKKADNTPLHQPVPNPVGSASPNISLIFCSSIVSLSLLQDSGNRRSGQRGYTTGVAGPPCPERTFRNAETTLSELSDVRPGGSASSTLHRTAQTSTPLPSVHLDRLLRPI